MDLTLADLRGTLLVRDCLEADGAFLLVQIIKTALQGVAGTAQQLPQCPPPPPPPRVVLLAAAQVATHYVAVLRKAGLHAPALASAGRLEVIDVLPALGTTPTSLPSLRSVHQRLAAAVGGGSGGASGGVCLVADDLTALHCLAASAEDWGAFLHACTALGQVRQRHAAARSPALSRPALTGHAWPPSSAHSPPPAHPAACSPLAAALWAWRAARCLTTSPGWPDWSMPRRCAAAPRSCRRRCCCGLAAALWPAGLRRRALKTLNKSLLCTSSPQRLRQPPLCFGMHATTPPLLVQLVLEVEPLESGRSADATGRVMVVRREPAVPGAAADAGAPGTRRLCYRLGETGASYVTV